MELIEKVKKTGINATNLSKNTGIPVGRIYKWYDGAATPKQLDDIKLLEKFLLSRIIIEEKEPSQDSNQSHLALHSLIRSQENLIITNSGLYNKIAELEEKIKSLTKNSQALENATNLYSTQHTSVDVQHLLSPLLAHLANKLRLNESDLKKEVHKFLSFPPMVSNK